ncbi:MAG: response regulator [Nitrospirae bacterium]|nr:response regulator [Nitrospirota bacterium]
MVVVCPKCKTKLKVDDTKLSPQGSRFKCPKCSTVLLVKKPVIQEKKSLSEKKVLIAHSNPAVVDTVKTILAGQGYEIISSSDGIDTMVKALKELPWLGIIEVALPKIYGFEVCKRLKGRPETKEMKLVLVPSIYDKTKYRREPVSLYGADDYIEEHELSTRLAESISRIKGGAPAESETPEQQPAVQAPAAPGVRPEGKQQEPAASRPTAAAAPAAKPGPSEKTDEMTEKAKRLARTIINDIYLYNSSKVDESVRQGNFYAVFAAEVKEGKKLYDNRIPQETRNKADFFREAFDNFLAAKKKSLS